ncbi:MAG: NAD(P)-dependent oxidoreductase [Planctomycetota bacterium]|jgi:phosphoglycerate dehydrogenase-like enzyme
MPEEYDILLAETFDESALQRLASVGRVRPASGCDAATLIREVPGAHALLVRTYAEVDAAVLEAGSELKVVGRGGVGLENVDLAAARRRGITVVYTPAAASDSVAEFTVGLILALERHLLKADAMVRGHRFREARRSLMGRELGGLTLGIVGMGRIGRRVGRICQRGLGMLVRHNDIIPITGLDFEAESADKQRIWAESDVVSLHVPLTKRTRHLIDSDVLRRLKAGATLINTSRGPVVDATALAQALAEGRLAGAALDVHEPEPPPPEHPLLTAPNVLLTPHLAARTGVGLGRMNDVVDDVIAALTGQRVQHPAPVDE